MKHYQVIIVGAGPAGMQAALTMSRQGLQVLVVDRNTGPGGQVFHNILQAKPELMTFLGTQHRKGSTLTSDFMAGSVEYMPEATVWGIQEKCLFIRAKGRSFSCTADHIILATGAQERPVPVTGATLPGVITAGGADLLLKGSHMLPQGPIVLCGNGPLLVQAVLHLHKLGVTIAGIVSTAPLGNILKSLCAAGGVIARPLYMTHGAFMQAQSLLTRIPRYRATQGLDITQAGDGLAVVFSCKGKQTRIEAKTVLLHEGIVSETRLALHAGCHQVWNPVQRYFAPWADSWGNTSASGISVAGDCCGVLGAEGALVQGKRTALEVCRILGAITQKKRNALARRTEMTLKRMQWGACFIDLFFSPRPSMLVPDDSACVCRCEEVSGGVLKKLVAKGCVTPNALKAQARNGMGQCQGRMCESAVREIISHILNKEPDQIPGYTVQLPLYPVPLAELMDMDIPPHIK